MGTPFFVLSGGLAAWGKGLPSASRLRAGHVPPAPPACGPTPCPPWAAAGPPPAPSSPCRSGRGNVAAKAAPAARPGQVGRQPLRGGTPPQSKAKASRLRRALLCSSPAPVAAQVLRGGPAPKNGGFGAVRPSGPVGGTPASLASPATPTAQAVPRGSAYALAARRSGPGPLAGGAAPQPSRGPGCGLLLQPLPLRGAAIWTAARTGGASAAFPALRARRGAGERRLRAGVPAVAPAGKAKASPAQGGKPPTSGGLACQCPGQRWANVAGVPPSGGSPALFSFWGLGGAVMFAVACRVSPAGRVWWLVCRPGGVFGWSLSRSARSLWPSALAAASACQLAAASAPGTFWPAGASVGRLAVVRCG